MLDIAGASELDKPALIGGCLKLPMSVDAARLAEEVGGLPGTCWDSGDGRVGVQRAAQAVFLRGHAPAEGEKPVADRQVLDSLPYVRAIITQLIPAPPQRCLLARMRAGATIAAHVDRAPYFSKTLRLHIPVATHEQVWMIAGDLVYQMRAGEIWALNNSSTHAVWNAHPTLPRIHLICDYLPTPELLRLLEAGRRDCGRPLQHVLRHVGDAAKAGAPVAS
jgi:hypothetical protein